MKVIFKTINKIFKRLVFMCFLFAIIGCSKVIKLDVLDISPIVYEIPEIYSPPKAISNCTVEVLTTEKFNSRLYKNEMLSNSNKGAASSKTKKGLLSIPDIQSGQLLVYNNRGEKFVEITIDKKQITQVLISSFSNAQGKIESISRNNGIAYMLIDGVIRVQDSDMLYFERQVNKIEDERIRVTTKRQIKNSQPSTWTYGDEIVYTDKYYYVVYEKEYDNLGCYIPTNYNPQDYEPNSKLVSLKYFEEDGAPMSPFNILFLDNPDMLLFESDFVENGHRWYLALMSPNSSEPKCKGEFFSTKDYFKSITHQGAFRAHFDSLSVWFSCFSGSLRLKNYQYTYVDKQMALGSKSRNYALMVDEFGNISLKNDSVLLEEYKNPNPIIFSLFHPDYDSNIEFKLKKVIKERIEAEERDFIHVTNYYTAPELSESDMIHVQCQICGGTGKMAQSGNGIVLGYINCPQCSGKGTMSIPKSFFH